jgi:hypothetical protein
MNCIGDLPPSFGLLLVEEFSSSRGLPASFAPRRGFRETKPSPSSLPIVYGKQIGRDALVGITPGSGKS